LSEGLDGGALLGGAELVGGDDGGGEVNRDTTMWTVDPRGAVPPDGDWLSTVPESDGVVESKVVETRKPADSSNRHSSRGWNDRSIP